jgi:thioredoxin 1
MAGYNMAGYNAGYGPMMPGGGMMPGAATPRPMYVNMPVVQQTPPPAFDMMTMMMMLFMIMGRRKSSTSPTTPTESVKRQLARQEADGTVKQVKTQAGFNQQVTQANGTVVVVFAAPWCHNCNEIKPELNNTATVAKNRVKFVEAVIWDENNPANAEMQALATQYNIQGTPTVLVMRDGQVLKRGVGKAEALAILNEAKIDSGHYTLPA